MGIIGVRDIRRVWSWLEVDGFVRGLAMRGCWVSTRIIDEWYRVYLRKYVAGGGFLSFWEWFVVVTPKEWWKDAHDTGTSLASYRRTVRDAS